MQIDLSRVAETKGHLPKIGMVDRQQRSSASYAAHRCFDDVFIIYRMPFQGYGTIQLGKARSEAEAESMLEWWVQNDSRMHEIIKQIEAGIPGASHYTLMLECMRAHQGFCSTS